VEVWLNRVLDSMCSTVRHELSEAVTASEDRSIFPFYNYRRRARSGGCPKGDRERARRYRKVTRATKSTGVLTEQRVSMSEEWVHFKIQSSDSSRSTSLASLRNKIRRHETSRAHKIAQELTEKGGQDLVGNLVRAVSETVFAETDSVFRTAYYLAKMNRPFTDHDSLIELQEKNGANMGTSLHSSINGPPVTLFEPRKYVTTWLRSHRSATQARRQCTPQMPEYKHIWKAL
ncbi:E3 SUMO-protein ligase KIAA1586, partial [Dissostichus eleginoides]